MRFRDPVCGMDIRWEEAVDYAVAGPVVVYFCCHGCASRFREDPASHVDVAGWLSDGPATHRDIACEGRPIRLAGEDVPVRRSLHRASVPRIGGLTLDEFEALLTQHWRRLLGSEPNDSLRARVLERALLICTITEPEEGRRHDVDRMMAAEVARLRARAIDRERVRDELAVLGSAFAAALREIRFDPAEARRLRRTFADGVDEAGAWIATRPGASLQVPAGRRVTD